MHSSSGRPQGDCDEAGEEMEATVADSSAAQEQQAAVVANNQDVSRQDPPRLMQFVGDFELFHSKLLGRGAFSNVCEALHRQTNDVVAVKAVFLRDAAANQNELKINKVVQGHPAVVALLNHAVASDVTYMFFELCAGGELFHQITPYVGLQRREMIGSYYAQLVDAVEFVHDRGIAHLDIKAENIFIDESGSFVKLGDFGLSALVEDGPVFGCRGSLSYAAPENLYSSKSRAERVLLTGHSYGYDGVKADMWSCGILLYVMMYGCTPWEAAKECNPDFRVYRSTFGCPNVQPWNRMPTTFKTLFQRLLNITPNRRWSAQNLKEYIARSFGWKPVHRPLA